MEFSLVVAIRDTPQERDFAIRSLRAASFLNPTETIIGVDDPVSTDFLDMIKASTSNHQAPLIVRVKRSDEWKMHLAHVIHECYVAASCQKTLTYNIDSILQRRILRGCNLVGSQTPLVMYQETRPFRKPRDIVTCGVYCLYRIVTTPDTGTYWLHRPAYFECVDSPGFRGIVNGYDTYLINRIRSADKQVVSKSATGTRSLDYSNNNIPWRQFANGMWYGANSDKVTGRLASIPKFKIWVKSTLLDMPYMYRGFVWAAENPDHPAVQNARSKSFIDFTHQGSTTVEGILDWKGIGKLGVGYT